MNNCRSVYFVSLQQRSAPVYICLSTLPSTFSATACKIIRNSCGATTRRKSKTLKVYLFILFIILFSCVFSSSSPMILRGSVCSWRTFPAYHYRVARARMHVYIHSVCVILQYFCIEQFILCLQNDKKKTNKQAFSASLLDFVLHSESP